MTGGSSGIGLATAKQFVAEGAFVYISGRHQAELDIAVASLGTNARAVRADSSSLTDLDERAAKEWVGAGAVPIRAGRGTGAIIGEISADGQRVARFTSVNKASPYINLENKVTGGNLHVHF